MTARLPTPDPTGNPLWPLPPDYADLTVEGQRQARVAVCRAWHAPFADLAAHLFPDTYPSLTAAQQSAVLDFRATLFAHAVIFFDRYYLMPDPDDDFNPLFYDDDPLPSPHGHTAILWNFGRYRRNLVTCARGFAKSTLVRKASILRLVSRPAYSIMYATSTHDNAMACAEIVRSQCFQNRRIQDDFGPEPEFGGRIRPARGESGTGLERFQLNNGSHHRAISAEARQRGGRARRYVLDDPEYDYHASTSPEVRKQFMDQLLFKIIRPMVARAGAGVDWINTFVSRRHFAWHAMRTQIDPATGRTVAADDRFEYWARLLIPAGWEDPTTGELRSAWPEMWPATRADRLAMAASDPSYLDKDSLEELRNEMRDAFTAEYLCRPGAIDGGAFPPLTVADHGYTISSIDAAFSDRPWDSSAVLSWRRGGTPVSMPVRDFLRRCTTFITLDTSYTAEATSDYKVCCLMAHFGESNELFVLDLWASRCREPVLVEAAFRMADRWRCRLLAPEVIRESKSLYDALRAVVLTRAKDALNLDTLPAVRRINPGSIRKEDRIANALTLRADHGLIKFPLYLRDRRPWSMLFDQYEQFNPELDGGGLDHDDCLDCVAMHQLVVSGRAVRPLPAGSAPASPIDLIASGRFTDPDTHLPVAASLTRDHYGAAIVAARAHATGPTTNDTQA